MSASKSVGIVLHRFEDISTASVSRIHYVVGTMWEDEEKCLGSLSTSTMS